MEEKENVEILDTQRSEDSTPKIIETEPTKPNTFEVKKNNDTGSFGWAILGFFIPLAGLILFCVWRNDRPKDAKMAGVAALISFILNIVCSIICCCFLVKYLLEYETIMPVARIFMK